MAHFAYINDDNEVVDVIVAEQNFINSGSVGDSFRWLQTSYNGSFRGRFASIGGVYNKQREQFVDPSPFPSWSLNETSLEWEAPTLRPTNTDTHYYMWDEDTVSWLMVEVPQEVLIKRQEAGESIQNNV